MSGSHRSPRPSCRPMDQAATLQIGVIQTGRRIFQVESIDGNTAIFSDQQCSGKPGPQVKGFSDACNEDDFSNTQVEGIGGCGKSPEDI